jgi:prepilin-type N-terminal cleavage/methylation domain-containing protein
MRKNVKRKLAGFTLVELLVVMVILGILVSLVVVAATRALGTGQETQIKLELDNIALALEQYKNTYGSYPPNCVTTQANTPDADLERHLKKAFPRHREPINDLKKLCNPRISGELDPPLTPAEAIVFWLGGFSADPEYPITGPGGPSYPLNERNGSLFDFDQTRVQPSLDASGNPRSVTVGTRKILMFVYRPPKLTQPYVYFDTSRYLPPSGPRSNWPAYMDPADASRLERVRAYIRLGRNSSRPEFVNSQKFQLISAGLDDDWGTDLSRGQPIFFNEGPFLGGHADNLVNFTPRTLADSQP